MKKRDTLAWKGAGNPTQNVGMKGSGITSAPSPPPAPQAGLCCCPTFPPCWREIYFPFGCLGGCFRLQNPFSCCTSASALPGRDFIPLSCRSERLQEYFCTKRCLVPGCPWWQGTHTHHAHLHLCPALIPFQPSFCSPALTAELLILESRVELQGRE